MSTDKKAGSDIKVLNFASLNLDYVYKVDHIVKGGETIASEDLEIFCGGKGLNQSIALAKAGIDVYHAGLIGDDGDILRTTCKDEGVDTTWIEKRSGRSGHAIIQVDGEGENCIIIFPGTNNKNTKEYVNTVMSMFEAGDILVLQNEINQLDYMIEKAYARGMHIVLNPSPYNEEIDKCDMNKISTLILNEVEAEQILGRNLNDPSLALAEKFKDTEIILTLGSDGSVYRYNGDYVRQGIFPVKVRDTTAAGDTYVGYYLASVIEGLSVKEAMERAAMASAIAVSKSGASPSIPKKQEVIEKLKSIKAQN